jgi:hypothetical protein
MRRPGEAVREMGLVGFPDAGSGVLCGGHRDGLVGAGPEGLAALDSGGEPAARLNAAIGGDGADDLRPGALPALLGQDTAPGRLAGVSFRMRNVPAPFKRDDGGF